MLLIYDPGGEQLYLRVGACFTSRAVVQRWSDLHRLAPAAEGCILLVRTLRDPLTLQELERYRRCFPRKPTVLVVDGIAEESLGRRFAGWEVVWLAEVKRRRLDAALRAAGATPEPVDPASPPPAPAMPRERGRYLYGERRGA